jgi:hypothetical protein
MQLWLARKFPIERLDEPETFGITRGWYSFYIGVEKLNNRIRAALGLDPIAQHPSTPLD